ncbi:MAG: tryptophan--tRNA ligase [Ferruginibacter sp.]
MSQKEIVVSGIRSTGYLHLGNYFGAIRNYIKMQENFTCYFMVADLHSLTTHPDTRLLKSQVHRVLAENIACGLDPDKATIYCQSQVHETSELYLYLNMLAYKGELEKTVTFKDKVRQNPENVNAGLLTYPVLQSADILLHRASYVPVGKDQEQHLEMARNFVNRFNFRYGKVFPEPVAFNFDEELVKVPGLDGTGKMSKSENQMATLYLADDNDTIRKKIKKAKSDASSAGHEMPDSVKNLFLLMSLVTETNIIEKYQQDFTDGTIRYGDMKEQLTEDMIKFLTPIREKTTAILADEAYLQRVMQQGADAATESARATMQEVRKAMGLVYF